MSESVAQGDLCMLTISKLSNHVKNVNPRVQSPPYREDQAANRPVQVRHALRTGIVGLLLQTSQDPQDTGKYLYDICYAI